MRYLKKWKLFESISDVAYEKFTKAKSEYNDKIEIIKREYLEEVSECMFDLTDEFENKSSVEIKDGNILAKFKFDVKPDRIDDFFNIIENLQDLVKSYISEDKRFIISNAEFKSNNRPDRDPGILGDGTTMTNLHRLPNEINDVKVKIITEIERLKNKNLGIILITLVI
jgi:hypothetical protein